MGGKGNYSILSASLAQMQLGNGLQASQRNHWPSCPLHVSDDWRSFMKVIGTCAVLAFALTAAVPAQAKGCLKGALVGGAAGHYAGHHGWLGAAAGCAIGRHQANKRARLERQQPQPVAR